MQVHQKRLAHLPYELTAMSGWISMDSAPKIDGEDVTGQEILAHDGSRVRVIWWTDEYPCVEGVWCCGYSESDYIAGIDQFYPKQWQPLPDLPPPPQ